VLLPLLAVAGWQEGMTARVLDTRHLWLALSAWLVAVCGYLAGAYALLANRRYAVAGFIFLAGLCFAAASGLAAIALQLLALAWLRRWCWSPSSPTASRRRARRRPCDRWPAPAAGHVVRAAAARLLARSWCGSCRARIRTTCRWKCAAARRKSTTAKARKVMILGLGASRVADAASWAEQAAVSDVYTAAPACPSCPNATS
jgi:hypothetical protein